MGTEISYHQSQVGHEADESRAKRAEEEGGGGGRGSFGGDDAASRGNVGGKKQKKLETFNILSHPENHTMHRSYCDLYCNFPSVHYFTWIGC